MKKATGILLSVVVMSIALAGCYTKSCGHVERTHVSFKGDK